MPAFKATGCHARCPVVGQGLTSVDGGEKTPVTGPEFGCGLRPDCIAVWDCSFIGPEAEVERRDEEDEIKGGFG